MKNPGDKIHNALLDLVEISEETQKDKKDIKYKNMYSYLQWNKEFCTIKISTSRRAGHTFAISKLLQNKFIDKKIAIILPHAENLEKSIFNKNTNDNHTFCSIRNFFSSLKGHCNFDAIICDCSSAFKTQQINDIYSMASLILNLDNPSFIIFVQ